MKTKDVLLKRAKLVERAMELWELHGEAFRTNIQTYYDLLNEKKAQRIYPLKPLLVKVIKLYPKNEFLDIEDEQVARERLEELDLSQVRLLVEQIEHIVQYDFAYNTVKNRIYDYRCQLKRKNDHCPTLGGIDPSCSGSNRRVSRTTNSHALGDL